MGPAEGGPERAVLLGSALGMQGRFEFIKQLQGVCRWNRHAHRVAPFRSAGVVEIKGNGILRFLNALEFPRRHRASPLATTILFHAKRQI